MTTSPPSASVTDARPLAWVRRALARAGGESGVAAVEFALILPVLMTLLLGIIDWGYFFFLSETVVNAAREGARIGVVQSDPGLRNSVADSTAEAYLTNVGIALGTGPNQAAVAPSYVAPNLTVTVTVTSFQSLKGFLASPLIPTGVTYQSTMRWEMLE